MLQLRPAEVASLARGPGEIRILHLCASERRQVHLGAREIGTLHDGAVKDGCADLGALKGGEAQVGAAEGDTRANRHRERRAAEVGAVEERACELDLIEIGLGGGGRRAVGVVGMGWW